MAGAWGKSSDRDAWRGIGVLALLGLMPSDETWAGVMRARIDQLRTLWPPLFIGQALALGLTIGVFHLSAASNAAAILPLATASLLFGLLQTIMLMAPGMQTLRSHHHVRVAALLGAGQGMALAVLLGTVLSAAPGIDRSVALAVLTVSAGLMAIAFAPLHVMLASFAFALGAAFVARLGSPIAIGAALSLLPVAAIMGLRLARWDVRTQQANARDAETRTLTTRLVREYEAQGGGWFWETDADGRLSYLTDGVLRTIETSDRAALGTPLIELFRLDKVDGAGEAERTLRFHLSTRTSFADYSVQSAGGGKGRWWSISGRPVFDAAGRFRGFAGSGRDLTHKRRADAEITRMALFDGLTGLANRQRMRQAIDQALGLQSRATALFMIDLDRFKTVNDTLGHQVGDALLKQVAQRLQRTIGDTGLVGRLGGDEFQVLIADGGDRDRLTQLAQSTIATIAAPYTIGGTTISIGGSIGIAVSPDDGADSEILIRNADLALYAAKAGGRGIHHFYRHQLLAAAQRRRQLEDDLREALPRRQFHLAYQPVISTTDSRIVGYEALIRWTHPEHGLISPADFIPIAEECGLIEQIGEWVLRTACDAAARWPRDVRIAVNVSPIQFANARLPALVTSALAQSGLRPDQLELEITEGVFLNENPSTDRMFAALKGIGVRLALDDFGTGYSSLGYLKQAPFDKIKIDQSFVRGAAIEGSRNAAIIRAIVALADTLGMETTAEGVELQDEIELIRELGCSHIQGYVYGRPEGEDEVIRQLGETDGIAKPQGFLVSRVPRVAMLRTATVSAGTLSTTVRIRNITAKGAMIEGLLLTPGVTLAIEIFVDEQVMAEVRWAKDGKAGLQFAEPIELDRLIAAADTMLRRVA